MKKIKYRRADGSKFCSWLHRTESGWEKGRKNFVPGLYMSHADLPEILFLVEGEKDVDTLKTTGVPAVSLPDGAQSKWTDEYTEALSGKSVIILPDNDEPGQKYARMCAEKLHGAATNIWLLDLRNAWPEIQPKGNFSDMAQAMGADAACQAVMDVAGQTAPWKPSQAPAEAKPGIHGHVSGSPANG